jgi:hypothetical protein
MAEAIHKFTASVSTYNPESGETVAYPKALIALQIYSNYQENAYPLYELILRVTETERQAIVKSNVDFILTLNRYSISSNDTTNQSGEESSSAPAIDKILLTETLRPINKAVISSEPYTYDTDTAAGTGEVENAKKKYFKYSVYCVSESKFSLNDTIINNCYSKANVNEAIINLVSNAYNDDFYFQESNNVTRFDSLLIPPMSLVPAIRYLQDTYGVYTSKMNIFFDESKMFVYDIEEKNRNFENNLAINVLLAADNSNKDIYKTAKLDENDNVTVYLDANPMFISNYDVYRNTTGGTTVFNSYDDNYNIATRNYNNDPNVKKTRYTWNDKQNAIFEGQDLNNVSQIITCSIDNFDPSYISPSTKVNINGSDVDEINSQYNLLSKQFSMTTTDYINFTGITMLILGKLN